MATAPWEASASSDELVFPRSAWCLEAWGSLAAEKSGSILAATSGGPAPLGQPGRCPGPECPLRRRGAAARGPAPPVLLHVRARREGGFQY